MNSTGIAKASPFLEITEENWDGHIKSHLYAYFFAMQAAGRHMAERRYGRIVNIASVAGVMGPIGVAPYGAAKAGILGLTRAASLDLADHGITVNAIAPGPIETELLRGVWSEDALRERAQHQPIARLGAPAEVAGAIAFLVGPDAAFATGITIPVDGGAIAAGSYMVEKYRRRKAESA